MKQIIADNQLISIIFLAIIWWLYNLSWKTAVKQVFPFLFSTLWYITCYVLYYCLHGFVNRGLRGVKINPHVPLLVILCIDLIVFVLGGLYFNELIGFFMIHVFTWYLKEYKKHLSHEQRQKLGTIMVIVGVLGWIIGAMIFNCLGVKYSFLGSKFYYWNRFYNPFILSFVYGFMITASQNRFYSVFVNRFSGLSLYIYMITGNQLLRVYPDNALYDFIVSIFGSQMDICALFVIAYTAIKLIIGVGLSIVYKQTLSRLTRMVSTKEYDWIRSKLSRID